MIKGTTKSGFAFELNEELMDDFELVELYAKVDQNIIFIGQLAEKLLGSEQKKALMEHLRKDGKIKTSDMLNALVEIESAFPASKNSESSPI